MLKNNAKKFKICLYTSEARKFDCVKKAGCTKKKNTIVFCGVHIYEYS